MGAHGPPQVTQPYPGSVREQHEHQSGLGQCLHHFIAGVIPSGFSGPWVSSTPAAVYTIGAVMSKRSSRADNVPHANTSPAMIARSATVTTSPGVGCYRGGLLAGLSG